MLTTQSFLNTELTVKSAEVFLESRWIFGTYSHIKLLSWYWAIKVLISEMPFSYSCTDCNISSHGPGAFNEWAILNLQACCCRLM